MAKSLRTIKKSAAKSSVSRSKLRSAVKKASSAAKTDKTFTAKKAGHAAKKGGVKSAKKGSRKKSVGKHSASSPQSSKADLMNAYVHQPSVIRPVFGSVWTPARTFFGSKGK